MTGNSTYLFLCALVFTAICGNIFIRRLIKRIDESEPKYKIKRNIVRQLQDVSLFLDNWGKIDRGYCLPDSYLPLHISFKKIISDYQKVAFEPDVIIFDRSLTYMPFMDNPDFLQIGNRGDGSEVLIRLKSSDPKVYIANIEDGTPENPEILAESLGEYFSIAKEDYDEANKILRNLRMDENI